MRQSPTPNPPPLCFAMIEKIIEFSIRNRFVVILAACGWSAGASTR